MPSLQTALPPELANNVIRVSTSPFPHVQFFFLWVFFRLQLHQLVVVNL